jgi:hypothetical protein
MNPNFVWSCVVIAPTGDPIPGTEAWSKAGAMREFLGQREPAYVKYIWDIAVREGYKIGWIRRDREEDEPAGSGIKAGTIVHGRGARWFI